MAITLNGSGTIAGISQGGLPDGVVTASDISSSDVALHKVLYRGAPSGVNSISVDVPEWANQIQIGCTTGPVGTSTMSLRFQLNDSDITTNYEYWYRTFGGSSYTTQSKLTDRFRFGWNQPGSFAGNIILTRVAGGWSYSSAMADMSNDTALQGYGMWDSQTIIDGLRIYTEEGDNFGSGGIAVLAVGEYQ